jgi:predicted metal-dependent HD superfamily phosphohydrolase
MATIKQEFLASLGKYTSDSNQQQAMWTEVEKNYTMSGRHYHNLDHLDSMLTELKIYKDRFGSWDTMIFAITYHDLIYSSLKSNNEERSAKVASKRLSAISYPEKLIAFCQHLILATKKHELSDAETNLFIDADLAILGSDTKTYQEYSKKIRHEYSIYPDVIYNSGRKKS